MLNLKYILKNTEIVKKKLSRRGIDVSIIDRIVSLGKDRSVLMSTLQNLEAKKNSISKEIGALKAKGESVDIALKNVALIKEQIEGIKFDEEKVVLQTKNLLLTIPNLPSEEVPLGKSEIQNIVIDEHVIGRGKVENIVPHFEIGVQNNIIDFERAVKLSGARFWSYIGQGAKLERSLINFMLDEHTKKGYVEIVPPVLVKDNILVGTGQLPKFKDDLFKVENKNLYLTPTAEVSLTNLYANEILDLSKPIKMTAYTPCFRAEAGSGGKDLKGLIRSHQFNKVELVKIVSKKDGAKEFSSMLEDAKNILEKLGLTYRELMLCTGDLGFSAVKTIDLEVWMPSEKKFREVSSVSITNDFQARRASIRYKDENKLNQYAYTINGSGVAIDRVFAAIIEIYQNSDKSISIPDVLVPYMNRKELI